jgi:hypothetical protein
MEISVELEYESALRFTLCGNSSFGNGKLSLPI